jgi:hypothetical protein
VAASLDPTEGSPKAQRSFTIATGVASK